MFRTLTEQLTKLRQHLLPRICIIPDIIRSELSTKTVHSNTYTIHHAWMIRWNTDSGSVERAHVNTKRYRRWIWKDILFRRIPPHIQFGGAVEAGKGDPEFFNRWEKFVRKTFA